MSINALEVSRMLVADKKNNVPVTRSKDIIHGNKWLDEALENIAHWIGTKEEYEAQKDTIEAGTTVIITDDYSEAGTQHNDLIGRSAANAHPISAITGLQNALDGKADNSDVKLLSQGAVIENIKAENFHIKKTYTPSWGNQFDSYYDECCVINKKTKKLFVIYNGVITESNEKHCVIDEFDLSGNLVREKAYDMVVSGDINCATYDDNLDCIILCFTGTGGHKTMYNPNTMAVIGEFELDDYSYVIWDNNNKTYISVSMSTENNMLLYRIYDKDKNKLKDFSVELDSSVAYWGYNQPTLYNNVLYVTINGQIYSFDMEGHYISKCTFNGLFEVEGLCAYGKNLYADGHFVHNNNTFYVCKLEVPSLKPNLDSLGDKAIPFINGDLNNLSESGIFRCENCDNAPPDADGEFYLWSQSIGNKDEFLKINDYVQIAFVKVPGRRTIHIRWKGDRWYPIPVTNPMYNVDTLPVPWDSDTIEFNSHSVIRVFNGYCSVSLSFSVKKAITTDNFALLASAEQLPRASLGRELWFPIFKSRSNEIHMLKISPSGYVQIIDAANMGTGTYYTNFTYPIV